jgi:hypothetical protein
MSREQQIDDCVRRVAAKFGVTLFDGDRRPYPWADWFIAAIRKEFSGS